MKKIAIIHYRIGRTDGVSLEIAKRKQILESIGHQVTLIAGPESNQCDYIIPELEFDLPEIRELKENCFSYFNNKSLTDRECIQRINNLSGTIEKQLKTIVEKEHFDALLVHNLLSHGRHISAASAITNTINAFQLKTLSTNHDYYFDRPEYQVPRFAYVEDYLNSYLPPKNPLITHVSINSLAAAELKKRSGITSHILPDISILIRQNGSLILLTNRYLTIFRLMQMT